VAKNSSVNVSVAGKTDPTAHVWQDAGGSFAVANGDLLGQGISNLAILIGPLQPLPPDLILQATPAQPLASSQEVALVGRYNSTTNSMYLAELADTANGPVAWIVLEQNGQITTLASIVAPSASGTLEFELNNRSSLQLSLNGSMLLQSWTQP
jgi:hypothetical protein